MEAEEGRLRYSMATLRRNVEQVLEDLSNDQDLFVELLHSYPERFRQLRAAQGHHIDY